jgi:hypothetical protein
VGLIGFTVPSVFDFTLGGGIHMWDIRLKDFFTLLYVYIPATIIVVSTLTSPSVVQRYSYPLRDHCLFDKGFYPFAISEDLRPNPEREHIIIRGHSTPDLDYCIVLFHWYRFRHILMQPT